MIGKQFGLRLQTARRRAGLTQDELATLAECSSVTMSKLETGVNLPTLDDSKDSSQGHPQVVHEQWR